jgi:hypothetical protein
MLPSVNSQFTLTVSSQNFSIIRYVKYESLKYNMTECFRIMQQWHGAVCPSVIH